MIPEFTIIEWLVGLLVVSMIAMVLSELIRPRPNGKDNAVDEYHDGTHFRQETGYRAAKKRRKEDDDYSSSWLSFGNSKLSRGNDDDWD